MKLLKVFISLVLSEATLFTALLAVESKHLGMSQNKKCEVITIPLEFLPKLIKILRMASQIMEQAYFFKFLKERDISILRE